MADNENGACLVESHLSCSAIAGLARSPSEVVESRTAAWFVCASPVPKQSTGTEFTRVPGTPEYPGTRFMVPEVP
eukprot:1378486-Rhodomonas_salina.1